MIAKQRIIALFLAFIMAASMPVAALAAMVLPTSLEQIEQEAFAGDSSLQGLARIPDGVTAVGQNAFQGTGLFALDVSASVSTFAAQEDLDMTYVYFHGSETAVSGGAFASYVFAPAGSAAALWTDGTGGAFVDTASLATSDGFYYQLSSGSATLLCPVDPLAVPAVVTIPETVNGTDVTGLSPHAFDSCAHVTSVTVPNGVTAADGAYSGCPDATITTLPAPAATSIQLSSYSIVLTPDNPYCQLTAQVTSSQFSDQSVRYSVVNYNVVDITNDGWIYPCKDGTTYIVVTAVDGTEARCKVEVDMGEYPVSIASAPASAVKGEIFTVTLAIDNNNQAPADQWCAVDLVYRDADGQPLLIESAAASPDQYGFGMYLTPLCYEAASVDIIVKDNGWSVFTPGANSSVTIRLTDAAQAQTPQYIYDIAYNYGCPGGYAQACVKVVNPEALTGSVPVTITSPDGYLNASIGALTAENPVVYSDIQFPVQWDYWDGTEEGLQQVLIHIGEEEYLYWIYLEGLSASDCYVGLGKTLGRTHESYCPYAGQLPLTFSVADSSIATIDSNGSITGLKTGKTTGTVTTKTGHSKTFAINVAPMAATESSHQPQVSIHAPSKKVTWDAESSDSCELFTFTADNGVPLDSLNYVYMEVFLYDKDRELLGTYSTSCYLSIYNNSYYTTAKELLSKTGGERIYYMDAVLEERSGYTIGGSSTATVAFAYTGDFTYSSLFSFDTYAETAPGGTGTIEIWRTGTDTSGESTTFTLVPSSNQFDVVSTTTAVLAPEDGNTTIDFTLSDYSVPCRSIYLALYANGQKIGSIYVNVSSGVGQPITNTAMRVGETLAFPIALNGVVEATDLFYNSSQPEVASVDGNGLITALAEGGTYVSAQFTDKYGMTTWIELWVYVTNDSRITSTSPMLALNSTATSIKYGESIPIAITLTGCTWDEVSEESLQYSVGWLDERMNELYSSSHIRLISNDERSFSVNIDSIIPPNGTKYLYISPYSCSGFRLDYTPVVVNLTDIPETIYTVRKSHNEFYLGKDLEFTISRSSLSGNLDEVPVKLQLADGTVLYSGTFAKSSTTLYAPISPDNLKIDQPYTVSLWVDGKDTGKTCTFTVEERELCLFCASRISIGEVYTVTHTFDGDYSYSTDLTYASSDTDVLTVNSNGEITGVSAGTAIVTVTTEAGQQQTCTVHVYDPDDLKTPTFSIAHAGTGNTHTLEWFASFPIIVSMDVPAYQLDNSVSMTYHAEFLDNNSNLVAEYLFNENYEAIEDQSETIMTIYDTSVWYEAFASGATQLRFSLRDDDEPQDYLVAADCKPLMFTLPSTSDYPDPVVIAAVDTTSTYKSGDTVTVSIECLNPDKLDSPDVYLEDDYGVNLASGVLTATQPKINLSFTVPQDVSSGYWGFCLNYDGGSVWFSIPVKSNPRTVTTLAELATEHNYPDNITLELQYTYPDAESLEITFHESTRTEDGCDPIHVGTPQQWEDSLLTEYSGTALAGETVTVTGDTVIITFSSDYSICHWGFAVTQIVAHMADGSTVTITE